MPKRFAIWPQALSIVLLLAVWQVAATLLELRVLPPPGEVFDALVKEIASGDLPYHLAATLARVLASFALAMLVGVPIGIAMGRSAATDRLLDPWLILFLNVPALVVALLFYVWFGLIEAAAVTAVAVNKIPNTIVTLREGARALDRDFMEMARSFRLNQYRTMRHVVLPQLYPFLVAAARSGFALIWKIVLVVELLGRSNGVGFQLYLFFQLFDIADILAYTVAFVAVVLVVEMAVLQPLERRANRWRRN